jgi:transposase
MLTEAMWGRLAPLLPPQQPKTGRPALDHRRFLEAVLSTCHHRHQIA